MKVAELERRSGLGRHTLRYYERIGLIAPIHRASGGQRRYAASDMAWVEFLLRLRTTNMPIATQRDRPRWRAFPRFPACSVR